MFTDVTRTGLLSNRLVDGFVKMTDETSLNVDEKLEFLRLLLMTANKLGATWYHRDRYGKIEDALKTAALNQPIPAQGYPTVEAARAGAIQGLVPPLYYEFDAFLVQLKSTLDHLVKIPRVTIGRAWNLATFGEKGKDVMNMARNVPAKYSESAKGLMMIVEHNLAWISEAVAVRDRTNHLLHGGITPDRFTVFAVAQLEGEPRLVVPMWSPSPNKTTVRATLEDLWPALFHFAEDFIGTSLAQRLVKGMSIFRRPIPLTSLEPAWLVTSREEMDRRMPELLAELGPGDVTPYVPPEAPRRRRKGKEPCHCGSGRAYKKCHLKADEAAKRAARGV
jgi:hypothetical protein